MKKILLMAIVVLLSAASCESQINDAKTTIVKVYGNCEICKATIEKAADKKKISKADWNKDTKMATITYNGSKTTLNAVLKNIALAGYDNEKFFAPDEAYANLMNCCKYDRHKKIPVKDLPKEAAVRMATYPLHNPADTTATEIRQANQLQAVFDNYFLVKDALVKTDGVTASAKAALLLAALNDVKMETLKTDEHMAWMKVEKELKTDAKHIAGSKAIESQRAAFSSLSGKIYVLIKAAKPAEKIYYQNCPMYNDGKGANWLSKETIIKNPYYGSMMLNCGKTVETIQ